MLGINQLDEEAIVAKTAAPAATTRQMYSTLPPTHPLVIGKL